MNTSRDAVARLQEAIDKAGEAAQVMNNLVIEHDYQDVALLIARAGAVLLEAAARLMESDDEAAFDRLDEAEDVLDEVYKIIDGETDEE
ncbi:hypothetical protein HC776_03200 [bacterium]|nr:hypothetical protein [bacterium]